MNYLLSEEEALVLDARENFGYLVEKDAKKLPEEDMDELMLRKTEPA